MVSICFFKAIYSALVIAGLSNLLLGIYYYFNKRKYLDLLKMVRSKVADNAENSYSEWDLLKKCKECRKQMLPLLFVFCIAVAGIILAYTINEIYNTGRYIFSLIVLTTVVYNGIFLIWGYFPIMKALKRKRSYKDLHRIIKCVIIGIVFVLGYIEPIISIACIIISLGYVFLLYMAGRNIFALALLCILSMFRMPKKEKEMVCGLLGFAALIWVGSKIGLLNNEESIN